MEVDRLQQKGKDKGKSKGKDQKGKSKGKTEKGKDKGMPRLARGKGGKEKGGKGKGASEVCWTCGKLGPTCRKIAGKSVKWRLLQPRV